MGNHSAPRGAAALSLVIDHGEAQQDDTWRCPECARGLDASVSAIVKVTRNPRLRAGRIVKGSGQPIWACAVCLARGIITRVE